MIAVHGWLNLNKAEGMSSAKAVAVVKRLLGVKKVGHTGTLDPLACGVLPLALGEATKLSQYIVADRKSYRFTVKWGEQTSTDDREGDVIQRREQRPEESQIRNLLPQFMGEILQQPPDFSAIKVAGERAYKKARQGKKVEIPPRNVQIYRLSLEESEEGSQGIEYSTFIVECGKGTYVRSLARDMGNALGCLGYVTFLQRLQVGVFALEGAVSLDIDEKNNYQLPPDFELMSMDGPLDDIPAVQFSADQAQRLKLGQVATPYNAPIEFRQHKVLKCYVAKMNEFFALGHPSAHQVKPMRVFNF